MKRSLFYTAVLALLSLLLSGCWDRREINDLAFVMAIGVDKGTRPGTFIITSQVAVPSEFASGRGGEGGGGAWSSLVPPVWITSIEGETVMDARRRMAEWAPRRGYTAHAEAIVLGKELARQGIAEVLDFFYRHPEFRRTAHLFVADGTAQSILQAYPRLDPIPGMAGRSLVRWSPLAGTALPVTLQEAVSTLWAGRTQLVLPRLSLTTGMEYPPGQTQPASAQTGNVAASGMGLTGDSLPTDRQGKGGEGTGPGPHGRELHMMGGAIFKGDRLVGYFNRRESRGYMWILGKKHGGITVVSSSPGCSGRVAIEITRGRARIVPELTNGHLRIRIQVKEEGNVVESLAPLDFTDAKVLRSLERRTATAIRGEIMEALRRAQKDYRSDVFGFGAAIYRRYPRLWRQIEKDWDRIYPDLEVVVEVESKIRRTMQIYRRLPYSSPPPEALRQEGEGLKGQGQEEDRRLPPHQSQSRQEDASSSARGGARP